MKKENYFRNIKDEEIDFFNKNGYLLLEDIISNEMVSILLEDCEKYQKNLDLIKIGCIIEPVLLNNKDKIEKSKIGKEEYKNLRGNQKISSFLFGDFMKQTLTSIFGSKENIYLYNENYITKPPSQVNFF
jgi:Asp-tRNA(Asn)/Glu-tRNA(Gln) amidotransferase B subunit